MTNTDIFIEKYKELEMTAVTEFNLKEDGRAIYELERMEQFEDIQPQLYYCRNVRNLLQHNAKYSETFAVQPSQEMIDFITDTIHRIKNPTKCLSIATPFGKLYWRTIDSNVVSTMKTMKEHGYSHVPILSNNKVVGIFSENSIFNYLMSQDTMTIDEDLRFKDIKDFLSLQGRKSHKYVFMDRDAYLPKAEKVFEKAFRKGERIAMILITEKGSPNERLLGVITAWDVLGH